MDNNLKTGLGQRLSLLAKLRGLTQEQIAKKCSMSRISVNRFFKEHTELRASDFKMLLSTLGIDLDAVIDQEIQRQMYGDAGKPSASATKSASPAGLAPASPNPQFSSSSTQMNDSQITEQPIIIPGQRLIA